MGKPGRPPTPAAEALVEVIQARVTKAERKACEQAAEQAGQKVSAWARDCLLRAAKRSAKGS